MLDVVNVSTGRNSATYDKFPNRVLTGTYDTGFHTRLMAKDVRLFNSVAAEVGTLHEVSDAVGDEWNAFEDAMPASDFSEIWKYVSSRSRGERGRRQQARRVERGQRAVARRDEQRDLRARQRDCVRSPARQLLDDLDVSLARARPRAHRRSTRRR